MIINNKRIIIIGNGVAGNSAAETARNIDKEAEITIISNDIYPLYSPCVLPHYLAGEIDNTTLFLKEEDDYLRENINYLMGKRVTDIDVTEKKVLFAQNGLKYDKLVMATGCKPLILPIQGNRLPGVFTLKTVQDINGIKNYGGNTAVIVGTGLVGIEGAVALKNRGYEVYLIELLDRIMPKNFNIPMAKQIKEILEDRDIKVLTGERVESISGKDRVKSVITDKRIIDCDVIILAAGMRPNVELAQKVGIEIGITGGIKVNKYMETNISDIYACGDCVESQDIINSTYSLNLLWGFAQKQGEIAGSNCTGKKKEYYADIPSVGTKLFDTAIASIGITADEDDDSFRLIESEGLDYSSTVVLKDESIVGAQMIGKVNNIGLFSSLIREKIKIKDFKVSSYKKSDINPVLCRLKYLL